MQTTSQRSALAERLAELTKPVEEMEDGLLASATYDGDKHLAVLKFYDHKNGRFWLWNDNTGHRPYCVPGDTMLLGDNKSIADVSQGEHVLGFSGEVLVEGKSVRPYTGDLVKVHATGLLPINVTPKHPILAVRPEGRGRGRSPMFGKPSWKLPTDLQPHTSKEDGDYLVFPVAKAKYERTALPLEAFSRMRSGWLKVSEFPLNEDTAWLLGLYVAEGSPGGRRGAVFSLNKKERTLQDKIRSIARDIGYSAYCVNNGRRSIRVHLGGHVMSRAMSEWCGRGATRKKIPDFILFHSNMRLLKSFLEGYSTGDGSTGWSGKSRGNNETNNMSSVSLTLVLQLQQAFARLGIFARITRQHSEGDYLIEGRRVHQKEAYAVRFVKRPKFTWTRRVGDFFYVPVRKVESTNYSGNVFNIQTSDSTYLVNNIVVHNCYTRLGMDELVAVRSRKDVVEITEEERLDLLKDERVKMRKIIATDPLAIGGGTNSIRDEIKAWEADIKYYENFSYDRGLKMGTYYRVSGGKVLPLKHPMPDNVARSLEAILKRNPPEFEPYLREWAELLGEPLVEFKRVAMDIEVANEEGRMPDPEDPTQPIISVAFVNDQEKIVFALRKPGQSPVASDFKLELFDDETDLIRAVFAKMMEYPVIITFNGDNFDLRYLKHRADKRKIPEEEDPIELQRVESALKYGIHLDLYNFFKNRSIQVYAFSNKYSDYTLNTISEALIGKSKIEFEGNIGDLPLEELVRYNLNDSQLTYELTSIGGSVAMKLLLVIARIGKMPMNDVGRLGVSNWIRSMLFFEHRKLGALIPRPDELSEKGGATSQAIIKGKKYKGGLVIEPTPGVYFDVSVFDFASLYPSLIKVHNLSYETVNCPHEECRSNGVPETASWVCRRRKGITSLVIGSLRDLRVSHYKPLAKSPSLSKDDRELYNVVSQGLKVFLNATYGAFGFESFAFYCLPVAEATAALGRFSITKTIEKCRQLGINVLYSDSVTGERCVTLLDRDGFLRVVPIERFFESIPARLVRPDGKEEAHPDGWKALSMNPMTGRVEFRPVKAVIRHRTSKRIFRVRERLGVTRVTEDHSLLASDSSGLKFSSPLNLRGQRLVRAGNIPSLRKIDEVDVYQLMKDIKYETNYKGGVKVLRAHCDTNSVWFGWTSRKPQISVKRHIGVGSPEFDSLVELLGAYVPEGSSSTPDTTSSRFCASIANEDIDWLSHLRESYLTLFGGASASIIRSTPNERRLVYETTGGLVETTYLDRTYKLQMMNETAAVFFKALAGQGSRGKKIPDFIFHVPEEYKRMFLESLGKGDGSKKFVERYSTQYASRNFKYETASLELASGLSTLLILLGVGHTIGFSEAKGTYSIVTSSNYNRRESVPKVSQESYDGYVYDLSVADYHTFVDSCGGLVLKNTDSLFLQNPSNEQSASVTKWADEELGVELDLDKSYRYVAFSSRKKNYFGVLPDGTVDIRGLTGKKSQTPEYLKKNFYDALEILSSVRSPDDFERARARTRELLTSMVNNLKAKKVPVADLAFNVMMGKPTDKYSGTTPQHVRAAQALEQKGREIKAGDIIGYVKTKSPPYVKPVEQAKAEDIDPDKYIEYAHSMFDQMLDALDFSFDEIMGATTLDFFWS